MAVLKQGLVVPLLFAILIGCDGNENKLTAELLYWSSNNPYEIEFADSVVSLWNRLNPEEPIVYQPVPEGRSSEEVILAAVVGRTTPDFYSNIWQGDVEFFAQSGVLVALDTLNGFMDFLYDRCDSSVVEEIRSSDGHIYQIPWKINPIMMIYNVNIFRENGYPHPPVTYKDYLEAAEKISIDRDGDGYFDRWIGYRRIMATWWQRFFDFYPLYLGASGGAKLVDRNKVLFDNKYAVQVFRFLKTLYDKKYFTRESLSARQDAFLNSDIATRFTGPWEIVHAEKFKPEGFDYGFSPLPVPDDSIEAVYTYGDPKNIVIFNTCKQPEKAWRFLRFMMNVENDFLFLKMTTQLPRRKNLFKSPLFRQYFEQHPKMLPFARQALYVRGTDTCARLKEVFDIISQEYEACVIYGTKSPEQAIHDAAAAAQVILN